jgi:hypothetical protein
MEKFSTTYIELQSIWQKLGVNENESEFILSTRFAEMIEVQAQRILQAEADIVTLSSTILSLQRSLLEQESVVSIIHSSLISLLSLNICSQF